MLPDPFIIDEMKKEKVKKEDRIVIYIYEEELEAKEEKKKETVISFEF